VLSGGPQPVALRHVSYTEAHLQSHGDEPGPPGAIAADRETPVKYFEEIKGCTSKKVTQPTNTSGRMHAVWATKSMSWKPPCCQKVMT